MRTENERSTDKRFCVAMGSAKMSAAPSRRVHSLRHKQSAANTRDAISAGWHRVKAKAHVDRNLKCSAQLIKSDVRDSLEFVAAMSASSKNN